MDMNNWKTPGFLPPLLAIMYPICTYLAVSIIPHETHPYIAIVVGAVGVYCIFLSIYLFQSWLREE